MELLMVIRNGFGGEEGFVFALAGAEPALEAVALRGCASQEARCGDRDERGWQWLRPDVVVEEARLPG